MWYNFNRLLTYNALLNFVMSPRGNGKTYSAKRQAIKNFKKKKKQFIYVRRYKTEFKKITQFFEDIKHEFPEDKFEVKGGKFYINGEIMGFYIPLSTSQTEKSTSYPNVNFIIFDEFVIDKSHIRYLTNEVEVFLDLFETVARTRDNVRAIFLANKVSVVNPYFSFFKIVVKENERFTLAKDGLIVVEMFTDEEFIKEKLNTKFGRLINETKYGDYAILNKSLRDTDTFLMPKKPSNSTFMFSISANSKEVGVWLCLKEGILYCNNQIDKYSKRRFSLTKEDHAPNYILINTLNKCPDIKDFKKYFEMGLVYFNDYETKTNVYNMLKYLNTR